VTVIHETTSNLEMHHLDHCVICRCRKHQQLAHQVGGFGENTDVSMVYSLKLTFIANENNLTGIGLPQA
jgi:hypothetical protein